MSENYKIDYDEISPIGGNKTVLVEHDEDLNDDFKLCMETGYHTYYKTWRVGNGDLIKQLEKQMSEEIRNSRILISVDKGVDKVAWYPFTSFNQSAVLYPEFDSYNQIEWKISRLKRVRSKDELDDAKVYKYPDVVNDKPVLTLLIPDGPPEHVFKSNEFESAFDIFETEYKITE